MSLCVVAKTPKSYLERVLGVIRVGAMDEAGSWFIPSCRWVHTFFLRRSIDCIAIDDTSRVARIYQAIKPWRIIILPANASDLLELPAGEARNRGFKKGTLVSIRIIQ